MKTLNKKTIILTTALVVLMNVANISDATNSSKPKHSSQKQAMIEQFFGKGKKLTKKERQQWRKAAIYGDCAAKHDFAVYLAREGDLQEAKEWFQESWNWGNGCLAAFRRIKQVEQIQQLEKQKQATKSKTKAKNKKK